MLLGPLALSATSGALPVGVAALLDDLHRLSAVTICGHMMLDSTPVQSLMELEILEMQTLK